MTPIPIPSQYGLLHLIPITLMLPYPRLPRVKLFPRPLQLKGPSIYSGTAACHEKKYVDFNGLPSLPAGRMLDTFNEPNTAPAVPNASARYLAPNRVSR